MTRYISILAIGLIITSCQNKNPQQQAGPPTPNLPVVEVPARDIEGLSSYPVSLEGIVNAEVRAKISGYITQVLVDEGAYVQKGQPLFRLETESLSEEALAAKANVDAAQVGVDQLRPLVEKNIVSPVQLQTAEAKLAQAKAAYKSVTANIGYANITSPVAGYVGKIAYRQGSLVNPTSPLPLTTVSNTSEVFGYFSMNEADYVDFLQKTEGKTLNEKMAHFPQVQLRLANRSVYEHNGKIQTVTAQVDPNTGSVSFRAVFPNPEHLLANGSSGTILIPRLYKNALIIPEEASFEMQGKTYAFQLTQDNTVKQIVLDVEEKIGSMLIVRSGIQAGDKIVAQGAGKLREGATIIPTEKSFDSLLEELKPVFQ